MKIRDFEQFIKSLSPDLYSFSYALISDDLQASQVVLDSVSVLILERKALVEDLLNSASEETELLIKKDLEVYLYRTLFELTKKRLSQLRGSLQGPNANDVPFFTLPLEEKALLFLNEWTGLTLDDLCFILGKEKIELLALLNTSKDSLKRKIDAFSNKKLNQITASR